LNSLTTFFISSDFYNDSLYFNNTFYSSVNVTPIEAIASDPLLSFASAAGAGAAASAGAAPSAAGAAPSSAGGAAPSY